MIVNGWRISRRLLFLAAVLLLLELPGNPAFAADASAFPEKFMLRLSSYNVEEADTDIAVFTDTTIGTGVSFADDLGGDTRVTIPRIDLRYRFNQRHRIDFTHLRIERDGRELLQIDISFEGQSYSIGETVVSDISYELFKLGYAYSFYHSPVVELGFTAGLNLTSYDFDAELADGTSSSSSEVTAPLPMFGLSMSYAITPKLSIHYLSETFFIELGDELKGAFLNHELNLRYKLGKSFLLGAGITRLSVDMSANDEDWRGRISDSHRGLSFFVGYFL